MISPLFTECPVFKPTKLLITDRFVDCSMSDSNANTNGGRDSRPPNEPEEDRDRATEDLDDSSKADAGATEGPSKNESASEIDASSEAGSNGDNFTSKIVCYRRRH